MLKKYNPHERASTARLAAVELSAAMDDTVRQRLGDLPKIARPARDCCQNGCFGCPWADAMRAHGLL